MKKYKLTKDVLQYVGHLHDAVNTLDDLNKLVNYIKNNS